MNEVMTAKGSLTINAAFLQEIKEDNRELPKLLRQARVLLNLHHTNRIIRRRVVEILHQLEDQLALHFALEEAFGYFEDAISVAPHLSERSDELRSQHASMFCEMCDLVDEAEKILYRELPAKMFRDIQRRFQDFDRLLQVHETSENELILQAFDEEIGVGD